MLLIVKGASNPICDSVLELSTDQESSSYKLKFVDEDGKGYEINVEDESLFPENYSLFTIVEGTDITFKLRGYYTYYIYDNNNAEIKKGQARVIDASEAPEYFFQSSQVNNYSFS